jgi:hypothetical protein
VAATPLTASKGDANGSMSVDVADVVTEVSYMTGGNPQPFIFEAADVNGDNDIDILDVVGTINIIRQPLNADAGTTVESVAAYSVRDGILYVESPVDIAGVQVRLTTSQRSDITTLSALDGFEKVSDWSNDGTEYLFLAYSLSGKTLDAGENALLRIGNAEIADIVISDETGHNVPVVYTNTSGIENVIVNQMSLPYPNPFGNELTVPYVVGTSGTHAVRITLTDLSGRVVAMYNTKEGFGEHSHTFATSGLETGMYFVNLYVDNNMMQSAKVVKK